jgi:hypothetical protein
MTEPISEYGHADSLKNVSEEHRMEKSHSTIQDHLMHNQNFAPPIQNPNFDVHKNRPDSQLINEALEKVSRKLLNLYCLRGF